MKKWLAHHDRDVAWITRENLRKHRLRQMDPAWTARYQDGCILQAGRKHKRRRAAATGPGPHHPRGPAQKPPPGTPSRGAGNTEFLLN